jgi:hypothetical protein
MKIVALDTKEFEALWLGDKTFDLRKDRNYEKGERFDIFEIDNHTYTGRWIKALITYVQHDIDLKDACILGLKILVRDTMTSASLQKLAQVGFKEKETDDIK